MKRCVGQGKSLYFVRSTKCCIARSILDIEKFQYMHKGHLDKIQAGESQSCDCDTYRSPLLLKFQKLCPHKRKKINALGFFKKKILQTEQ